MHALLHGRGSAFRFGTRRRQDRLAWRPQVEGLDRRCLLDGALGYTQAALASDIAGAAPHLDKDLMNPWGFVQTGDGRFRIAVNGAGNAPMLTAQGVEVGRPVTVPAPDGSAGAPTGIVSNTTSDFVIQSGGHKAPASLIFSTEDGTIAAWNAKVSKTQALIVADESGGGAVYKGLAMASVGTGDAAKNYVYATNFHNGTVDVFDTNFNLVHLDGSFTDSKLPDGFAPFGIANIKGTLYVSYAKQNAAKHDDVEGLGNGFVDQFDTSGHLLRRFATQGTLDSPWGMTVAPAGFGEFSHALLVGNFGNSRVNAFDLKTGKFLGQLSDSSGNPLVLNGGVSSSSDKGLWGLGFGNGERGSSRNTLYFASGVNDEADGVFGQVTANVHEFVVPGLVIKEPHFYEHYVGPKLPELNAVAAAVDLLPGGNFVLVGVNQGRIDPSTPAAFVFGIDRNGDLPPGPFPDRPDIRFDAVVVVNVTPGSDPTGMVIDQAHHTTTPLPAGSIRLIDNAVVVIVPGADLPSTGLDPSRYRFDYWPRDGQSGSTHIASFAPEFSDAPVGVIGRGDHGGDHDNHGNNAAD